MMGGVGLVACRVAGPRTIGGTPIIKWSASVWELGVESASDTCGPSVTDEKQMGRGE
jgi:hypothetical protein